MTSLPRLLTVLLRIVVPSRRVENVLADLAADYGRAAERGSARLWLAREATSLVVAYAMAPFRQFQRIIPMWLRDVQMVARGIRRGPLAAVGAAAMLSAGLLAVLMSVGLASALLFRPVSTVHGDALRRVAAVDRHGRVATRLSFSELQTIRAHLVGAAELGAVYLHPVVMQARGTDVQTMAELVEGSYFALTGATTIIGRTLLTTDEESSTVPVVVISEPYWRRSFGASPDALGQVIRLNRSPFTVIGVAASLGSSSFLGASVDAWIPTAHADPLVDRGWRTDITDRWFTSFVLPRAAMSEVESHLMAAADDLARQHPEPWRDRRLQTVDSTVLMGSQRTTVWMLTAILTGLAALILATAASNVGGVLLARATSARRHAAIHMSMGSGRAVMIRRQLLEGAAFGIGGGMLAIAFYTWARTWFVEIALLPTLALRLQLPLHGPLIALTLTSGALAGLLLALGPALWATRMDVAETLRGAELRTGTGLGLTRVRRVLVSLQVCLSLALVIGATLFARSVEALTTTDLGFARDHLVAMDFDVEPFGSTAGDLPALAREALARAQSVIGVTAAAMSNRAPVDESTPSVEVRASDSSTVRDVTMYLATAGYFDTIGIEIVAGRAFTAIEADSGADVAIVNQTLAARLWPNHDVLDRAIVLADGTSLRIVGVARDSKYRTLTESPRPHVYRPTPPGIGLTLLARTSLDPRQTLRLMQLELDKVGPGLVGFFPRTLDDHLAIQLLPTRAIAGAATGLGTLALALSAVGLYGLISWFVELRRREIGVRMALGASPGNVRRLVVTQALKTALPGIVAGIALSMMMGLAAQSALFGVAPVDPVAIATGVAALTVVVVAAGYVPSRRASRVDPATALRQY